jgi:hypothetical protein
MNTLPSGRGLPTPTPTPTRSQHYAPGPLTQKLNQISPKSTLGEHTNARNKAKDDVKELLGPQGCERLVSSAVPATLPPAPVRRQRHTPGPLRGKYNEISRTQEKYQYRMKQQREEEERKAEKRAVKTEKKKAAKEKKAEGKARRGSKREKVSEEQVQKKRARFEQKSGGARKSSQ